jgi:3D (Asp-Asp-Asp) domain-containing protein
MINRLKRLILRMGCRKIAVLAISFCVIIGFSPFLRQRLLGANAELGDPVLDMRQLSIFQENSLTAISSPKNPDPKVVSSINVILTAYSSTPWETDEDPFITAAGTPVRDGILANNLLPFGTKVRIPGLYGDKIFVVEDRMSWKKGNNHFDIWFSDTQEAKNFGVKRIIIDILES